MNKLEHQNVEDVSISFNKDIYSYVINISYKHTDSEGNVDIISITDLPIPIRDIPTVDFHVSHYDGNTKSIDLGFGRLDFRPGITRQETRRIHTATKEMTIDEIELALGHKVKIVGGTNEKEEEELCCNKCKFYNRSVSHEPCVSCRKLSNFVKKED